MKRRTDAALMPAFTVPGGNPYAADLLADVVLHLDPATDLRGVYDAAHAHPDVLRLKAQASGRFEHEAVIGSVASLVQRTAYRLAAQRAERAW
jgi:hypothetical protein